MFQVQCPGHAIKPDNVLILKLCLLCIGRQKEREREICTLIITCLRRFCSSIFLGAIDEKHFPAYIDCKKAMLDSRWRSIPVGPFNPVAGFLSQPVMFSQKSSAETGNIDPGWVPVKACDFGFQVDQTAYCRCTSSKQAQEPQSRDVGKNMKNSPEDPKWVGL